MLHDSTIAARLWSKAVADGTGCWVWQRSGNGLGYGKLRIDHQLVYAHRLAYEIVKGPIPSGLQIDHLCRNPSCINPDHLEAVTPRENNRRSDSITAIHARQTHCARGHPFDEANTHIRRVDRGRACRACHRDEERARKKRVRDALS